jgi:glycolate oxidase FAD binding subunit
MTEQAALESMSRWAGVPLPISATAWHRGELRVRLSGSESGVGAAERKIGGVRIEEPGFWQGIREQTHAFLAEPGPLWRVAVPSVCPPLNVSGNTLIEWGGALRWLRGDEVREVARKAGGHATLFRAGEKTRDRAFAPLEPVVMHLHRQLKAAFDPAGILNPGRMYPEL